GRDAEAHGPSWRRAAEKVGRHRDALLDRDPPVDAVLFRRVIARRPVVRAAVVPDDDVALAPLVAVLGVGLDHAFRQLRDDRVALLLVHALDPQDLARFDVERRAPSLGMSADDAMEHRLPVAVLLVEQRGLLPTPAVGEGAV